MDIIYFMSVPTQPGIDHAVRLSPKPKGMHWATFERRIARLERIEGAAMADMSDYLSRTVKRLGMPW